MFSNSYYFISSISPGILSNIQGLENRNADDSDRFTVPHHPRLYFT